MPISKKEAVALAKEKQMERLTSIYADIDNLLSNKGGGTYSTEHISYEDIDTIIDIYKSLGWEVSHTGEPRDGYYLKFS